MFLEIIKTKWFKNAKDGLFLGLSLARTNFKLRNEGSYLGFLWYLLEPFCFFVIILLVGGEINLHPIKFYPLYLLLGLIMFNFFSSTTSLATHAISSNGGLIKSMKIIQESLVMSSVFQFVFSHLLEMAVFVGFMIYFRLNILYALFYLPIFFFYILFVLGFSFILSAVGVFVIDLANIWAVFCRLIWFLTPIFYVLPHSILLQRINYFNPMYHFINISREIIIYHQLPQISTLLLAAFISIFSFFIGLFIFQKFKYKFAEYV